jgi:hypothetical protein
VSAGCVVLEDQCRPDVLTGLRAQTLIERLKDSPDWTQEKIDELRRRIEQDLERERL